jgi:hypothetical protein
MENLRAGQLVSARRRIAPDTPELLTDAIAFAIRGGEAHVLVGDPPTAIAPGDGEGWAALLARQAPTSTDAADRQQAR